MPNWCTTTIVFHGDEKEIRDFHGKIKEWTSESLMPNDYEKAWLGNILCGVGLKDRIYILGANRLRCRGSIDYIGNVELDGDGDPCFRIDTETAWVPMIRMWEETIKKLEYKSIGFSFQSEEPGCNEYFMFDPYEDFEWIYGEIAYEQLEPGDWY